jgi:hypothetical protein
MKKTILKKRKKEKDLIFNVRNCAWSKRVRNVFTQSLNLLNHKVTIFLPQSGAGEQHSEEVDFASLGLVADHHRALHDHPLLNQGSHLRHVLPPLGRLRLRSESFRNVPEADVGALGLNLLEVDLGHF